jgi:hypothetical protein
MLSGYLLHPLDLLKLREIKTLPEVQKTGRIRTELLEYVSIKFGVQNKDQKMHVHKAGS